MYHEVTVSGQRTPEQNIATYEIMSEVRKKLPRLGPKTRGAIERMLSEQDIKEYAAQRGVTYNTVKRLGYQGVKALRRFCKF